MSGTEAAQICKNCGTEVPENFCTRCGQEFTEKILPLQELFSDIVGEFVNWDNKITRSLLPLIFRPGFLTEEYIRGRWVSYLMPSRMFIIVNLIFFFLVGLFDPITFEHARGMAGIPEDFQPDAAMVEGFNSFVEENFPAFLFTMIPFFAAGMHVLYRRPARYLVEHMIFSFHFFSFLLIALIPGLLLKADIMNTLALLSLPVYLFFALRKVFGQSLLLAGAKALILYLWFLILLMFYFTSIFSLAFRASQTP